MRYRALALSVLLALSACASQGPSPPVDGVKRAQTEPERVHSIDDSEPLPPPGGAEPEPLKPRREARVDPFPEERRTIGFDPRMGDEPRSESRKKKKKVPPHPGLGNTQPELMAPMAGRVGIMSLIGNQLTHIHSGTFSTQRKDHWVQFDLNGYLMRELRTQLLTKTPYQPIPINATGALRKDHDSWHESWDGEKFAPQYQREIDGVISQNRLDMLIVVSYRSIKAGKPFGDEISGSGMFTKSGLGSSKAAVFSTFQFYRLVGTPAKLVKPIEAPGDRSIGDLPNAKLPDDLENLPARDLHPVYEPLRLIVQNKVRGLIALPRRLGAQAAQ